MTTRLLTFNLRQGGSSRLDSIVTDISRHSPDVAVLTEYHAKPGTRLKSMLEANGLVHQASSEPTGSQNGVLVAARRPFSVQRDEAHMPPDPRHGLVVEFADFGLGAVYLPMYDAYEPHMDWVRKVAHQRRKQPFAFVGDFNTLWLEKLGSGGFVDAWRRLNPNGDEYSWTNNNGTRTRIDYAFLSRPMLSRLAAAYYVHDDHENKISDHHPLIVELSNGPTRPRTPLRDWIARLRMR